MAETRSALDIVTGKKSGRPFITIDGAKYELAVKGDLGLSDQVKLQRLAARWEQITEGNAADLTDEQADAVEASFHWAPTVLVIGCPEEALAKLDDDQRVDILLAFSKAARATKPAPAKTTKPRTKRTNS